MIVQGYPRMCPNSSDYQEPEGYSVLMRQKGSELEVDHKLTDLGSLPGKCLQEGSAILTCEIRAPYMLYSRRHDIEHSEDRSVSGMTIARQNLVFPQCPGQLIYFIPAIVLRQERTITLDSSRHGTSLIWQDMTVRFPKGAILAGGDVFRDVQSVVHLLEFRADESARNEGVIRGKASEDEDQWRFVVHVHPDKIAALKDERHGAWHNALNVGCLAQMLEAIKKDFKDQEPSYEPLRVLAAMIQEETGKSPPWLTEDDGEWDDTLELATSLYKLITPKIE